MTLFFSFLNISKHFPLYPASTAYTVCTGVSDHTKDENISDLTLSLGSPLCSAAEGPESFPCPVFQLQRSSGSVQGRIRQQAGGGVSETQTWLLPHRPVHLQTQHPRLLPHHAVLQVRVSLRVNITHI